MAKILCILDGFGLSQVSPNNCAGLAKMPTFRRLIKEYPFITLDADGSSVGQEEGLVGNSEVGHMNLGGLKLVKQLSLQITESSKDSFTKKDSFIDQIIDPTIFINSQKCSRVDLVGLFSTGSIHSDLRHWEGAIKSALKSGANQVVLHLITDGRDSDRKSFIQTLTSFLSKLKLNSEQVNIFIGSIGGRSYAMDRDNNFDKVSYGLEAILGADTQIEKEFLQSKFGKLTHKNHQYEDKILEIGTENHNFSCLQQLGDIINQSYKNNIFDEFIEPTSFKVPKLENSPKKAIWLINFRADRMRQAVSFMVNSLETKNTVLLAMNDYGSVNDEKYTFVFKTQPVLGTASQEIAKMGKSQLHIAETEKYNHVTYFFNGGQDVKQKGEDWVLIPSNKVSNHSEMPEMKAKEVTDVILDKINLYDYIVVNYANPDMVGHCGDIEKGIETMEFLDSQIARLVDIVENSQNKHSLLITADHGNIEFVGSYKDIISGNDLTDTEHNANPVPLIFVSKNPPKEILFQDKSILDNNGWFKEKLIPILPLYKAGSFWVSEN
jgi:2,3-bisphosphoglycerate-independent phosphoglycerate mutase